MNRPYSSRDYLKILEDVKGKVENIVIGADIIVGFPGETEDDFQRSVAAAESGLIDYLHVFSYSDRPGTSASDFFPKISPHTIKQRNAILRGISKKHYAAALKRQIGKRLEVISEHRARNGQYYWGISDNYLKVALPRSRGGGKEIIVMNISGASPKYLTGEIG